ncbi:hypothetical protein cypCar_00043419 [Cyprinus carpio]|nr:hypothetical protein cypCar_00043419 [Cyprinus carpio]
MFMSKVTASFEVTIVSRLIFGLFCGLVMSLNPLYIQGVSPTNLHGAFATLNQVSFATGILLGMYVSLPFCPESPRYLSINRGKEKEAEAVWQNDGEVSLKKGCYGDHILPVGRNETFTLLYSLFRTSFQTSVIFKCWWFFFFFLISAYEVGPGPISWFIAAELFDQSARPNAMAFTSMLNWGGKFLLALLFPPLLKMCWAYIFLLFMCMALLAFTYTMFRLPETKGCTFDDIAAEFRGAEGIPLHNKTTFKTFT